MPRSRDQITPADADDRELLERGRGLGTTGTGWDVLPGEDGGPPHRFEVLSPAFEDGDTLPPRFAHDQSNVVPPLEWTGLPEGTAEVAVVCRDPDAPSGTFTHWLLAGLDPSIEGIAEGEVPAMAVEGRNDFGEVGWSGPEPPSGDGPHRYVFTVHASSAPLGLDVGCDLDALWEALRGHELARGQLVGVYAR